MKAYSEGQSCWIIQGCNITSANVILLDGSCWMKCWNKPHAKEVNFRSTSLIHLQASLIWASSNGDEPTKNSYNVIPRLQMSTDASCVFEQLYYLIKKYCSIILYYITEKKTKSF